MRSFMLRVLVLPVALAGGGCSSVLDSLPTTPDPVIVTDVFAAAEAQADALFYTALTRSTAVVRILCPTQMRGRIVRRILGGAK